MHGGLRGPRDRVLGEARRRRHEPLVDAAAQRGGSCRPHDAGQREHGARRDPQSVRKPAPQGHGRRHGHPDQEREEGRHAQRDRPSSRLGELRRADGHVQQEVRHQDHGRQPRRQLRAGERGDPLTQGRLARSGRGRRRCVLRDRRRQRGPVCEVLQRQLQDDSACHEGHPRLLDG